MPSFYFAPDAPPQSLPPVPFSILVVDDEEAVAKVLARGLRYAGYETTTAQSGSEALEKLALRPFDVLLTDINMPKMRGDQLQKIARERDPHLATLLITAADDTACAVQCLKEGAFDYLLKPFEIADVVVRVGKALERRLLTREVEDYRTNLEMRVGQQAQQIKQTVQGSLESLIHALEAKDPNTHNHSARVADLSALLARMVRPGDEAFVTRVRVAALFHDIGKIGVPEAILTKNGPLTEKERDKVRRHPEIGAAILSPLLDREIVDMVRSHHEYVTGGGYPDGISGEAIPQGGRIISVADAYDAMTSSRPYRSEIARHDVLHILAEGAGVQWDYQVVQALFTMAGAGKLGETLPPRTSIAEVATLAANLYDQGFDLLKPHSQIPAEKIALPPDAPAAPPAPSACPNFSVKGLVDINTIAALREKITEALRQGQSRLVIDLREASAITTENAQSVYALDLLARRAGGSLTLRDVPPVIEAVFESAGLTRLLLME